METKLPASDEVYRRTIAACEMLYGQPEAYYQRLMQAGRFEKIDFSSYSLIITGLACQVYRPYFGINAFDYTYEYLELEKEIRCILKEQGIACITTMLLYDHSKRMCMVFNTSEGVSANDVAEIVSSCFNRLYARIFDMSKTPYRNYTVLSEEIHGYENLSKTFREIDALSRQQFFDMRSMVMTPALLEKTRIPVDSEQIHEEQLQMYTAMRAGDISETVERYHVIMSRLRAARDFGILSDVLSAMRMTLEGILVGHGVEMNESDKDVFVISKHPTFEIMTEKIETLIKQSLQKLSNTKPMSAPILEAVRYIRHHYSENISVQDIAEHIGMSDSWLYKHFKQECECSILTYLMNVRIERSAVLLAQTDMLIMEIACAVGFENPGYFISVFKKTMGMTPKAFREKSMA